MYKKFYAHEITALNLSKIYFLKNAKKTCKPNKHDLNRDRTRSRALQFCCKVKFICILKVYKHFVALKRENHFRVSFFLSEFHLDILIWKFSVAGQNFIAIPKSILELFRKYFYFNSRSFGGKKCKLFSKRESRIILAVLPCWRLTKFILLKSIKK